VSRGCLRWSSGAAAAAPLRYDTVFGFKGAAGLHAHGRNVRTEYLGWDSTGGLHVSDNNQRVYVFSVVG
jgi:hypothetical protein